MKYKKQSILLVSMLVISTTCFFYSSDIANYSVKPTLSQNTAPPNIIKMDVPLISQKPELHNGCEITSLAMLLNYKGVNIDKMTLSAEMKKDSTPLTKDSNGNIVSWGNPKNGFVGDVTGKKPGYSIDPVPLFNLAENYFEGNAVDLTNTQLKDLENHLLVKSPIVVWVTTSMIPPKEMLTWKDGQGLPVNATFSQHAVLLTGFDKNNFYYNDPLSSGKNISITKEAFLKVWESMGKKAFTLM